MLLIFTFIIVVTSGHLIFFLDILILLHGGNQNLEIGYGAHISFLKSTCSCDRHLDLY